MFFSKKIDSIFRFHIDFNFFLLLLVFLHQKNNSSNSSNNSRRRIEMRHDITNTLREKWENMLFAFLSESTVFRFDSFLLSLSLCAVSRLPFRLFHPSNSRFPIHQFIVWHCIFRTVVAVRRFTFG